MDLKMKVQEISADKNPVWDLELINGIVPIIDGPQENMQTAILAAFLELGSIKQLPNVGVDWPAFITGRLSFGELDSSIRDSLTKAGQINYFPQYDIQDEQLIMTIGVEV